MIIDPWAKDIQDWLSFNAASEITTHEILENCLGLTAKSRDRLAEMRAGKVLRYLGFIKKQKRFGKQVKNIFILENLVDTEDTSNIENDDDIPF